MAKRFSQFPSAASISPGDSVVGLKDGANTRFSFATVFSYIQSLFVPTSRKVNNKALTSDITLDASDVGAVDTADVGVADGVASLDSNGKVPGTQLDLSGKQDAITANGILKGDGAGGISAATPGQDYQAPLTIDATPTASSTNPVQSGGVYTDVRTRVPNYGKGKNLLRNWYFVGGGTGRGVFPVNQRGQSSYYGISYSVDGWYIRNTHALVELTSSGLKLKKNTVNYADLGQYLSQETLNILSGKTVTLSWLDDVDCKSVSFTWTSNSTSALVYSLGGLNIYAGVNSPNAYNLLLQTTAIEKTFKAVKLELGTEQTLAHQENGVWVLNEIPDYEYELYRCITSTADQSDTYANKSLATEQQLAYVESGTTASRNYTAGQYISLNGLLYTADTAIASGATFYTSGGNKNLTECVGGGFNNVNNKKSIISTNVIFETSGRTAVFRSKGNNATSTDIRNAMIPQDYRPSSDVMIPFAYYNGSTWVSDGRCIRINSSTGEVTIYNLLGGIDPSLSFNWSAFCATWFF